MKISSVHPDEMQNEGRANMKAPIFHGPGKSVELHLGKLWARSGTITTRLVDTATMPMLLKLIISGKL
jgi:hypothetical protein